MTPEAAIAATVMAILAAAAAISLWLDRRRRE